MDNNEREDRLTEAMENDKDTERQQLAYAPDENEPARYSQQESPVPKHKKERKGWSIGIFGGLIGGIISAILVTCLFTYNLLPENETGNSQIESAESDSSPIVETLASEGAETSTNIQEVAQAVVGVSNLQQQSVWTESQEAGTGSGIIYKKEDGSAYVVTNQHVVEGAQEVEIILNDEERVPATVLGGDSLTDLAVLQVDGDKIDTVANLGTSENLQVGETVLAIGNPLGMEFANSVTKGIISGLNRSVSVDTDANGQADWITDVLQTDAAINPGNSGGALVNSEGEVIGINSMKIAQSSVEGIGFAIPVDTALPIIEQLEKEGEVTRPLIGISTASLNQVPAQYRNEINLPEDVEGGMVIANVQQGSPAADAGLQQFDVITKIDGEPITTILELRKYLYSETKIGDNVEIEYIRNGERQTASVQLKEMEQQEQQTQQAGQ
ncbi:S1C family serine protease [Oceanobacillus massiliensis]|uniref:S1C family serine protease n=1 Tax=Oceanobacillus massiliensis TaxID=1465765 RepID=UPI000288BEDF|nr:trypsin-like peptidase domain-containing protein [Oceanobacillus massiliensis]